MFIKLTVALAALGICSAGAFLTLSQAGMNGQSMRSQPSPVAGATEVGMEKCAMCHKKQADGFKHTVHGGIAADKAGRVGERCEACHGPGSAHVDSGGDKTKIIKTNWNACFTCHQRQRGEFSLQYRHPVAEGKMGCNSCHGELHAAASASAGVDNDTCLKCHQHKRGPWVFEHDAVKEGCTTCHKPHGSINTKLLTERDFNLCIKCHYSPKYQAIGHYSHKRAINPASLGARLTNCAGCHRAVHGSNFSKELRTE